MIFTYCPKCGEKLGEKEIGDEGFVPFCLSCNSPWFSFSYPCVLCLVVDEEENVVLTKAIEWANDNRYGFIGGYIKEGETAEDAAKREVEEEIGLIVDELKFIKTYCHNKNGLMIDFICKVKHAEIKKSEKELYSAEWFPINEALNLMRQSGLPQLLIDDYLQSKIKPCMIKQIQPSDFERCVSVIRASFITVAKELNLTEENCPRHTAFSTTVEKLQKHLNWGWLMYGLYEDNQIVGYVSLAKSRENDGEYELHNIGVLPEYRHKGYGKELLDFCTNKVKELGGNKIVLSMIEENTRLKNWYIQNGFVHTGAKKFDGFPFTSGFMEMKV